MPITCTGEVPARVEDEFCTLGGIQVGLVLLEYRLLDALRQADRTQATRFTTTRVMNEIGRFSEI